MVIGKRRQDQILNISSIHKMTANTKVNAVVVVVVFVHRHLTFRAPLNNQKYHKTP